MWEDNNPLAYDDDETHTFAGYGDSGDDASSTSASVDPPASPPAHLLRARTPSEDSDRGRARARDRVLDAEDEEDEEYRRGRREKGYGSRVEQLLLENAGIAIAIADAGKNNEGSGGYIVYTIRTGDLEVRRRYSEFESLRKNLSLLHPCMIVPPIPEKHQVSDYVTAPTSAKENVGIIDHRKRMLGVFLNRCCRMREIRYDSVFQRFLDPNASWSEVLHSPPISNLPKNHLRAPPLNPSEPTEAHQYLPLPPSSARLKIGSPPPSSHGNPPGNYGRFPPPNHNLSESELDPYFNNYETSTRVYESLLTGSIERVNRRILKRLSELSLDYNELGARYNAFSLSETGDLSSAIEKIGQAVDSSYIATEELARTLGSSFAEPLRESAQFAGVVQKVLRYRVLKRCQEEMTRDLLSQKRALLESLEKSEMEARRIEQYLHGTPSSSSKPTSPAADDDHDHDHDVRSLDSADGIFPPTHAPGPPSSPPSAPRPPAPPSSGHKKSSSFSTASSSLFARGFGKLGYAIHGAIDVDPERTRRDNIGKTRELLVQLEGAEKAVEKDVQEIGRAVLRDLRRFQGEKVSDLRSVMRGYAKCQIEWARRCQEAWREAGEEVGKIQR
ncbi:hypothetical protein EDC01DRAFT_754807 [Geopyxis carbonaria]|nr:hypothetical protein EDC01DRAFT_754807 [Geopyxis carbonaria]